jgi:hypothetical protein
MPSPKDTASGGVEEAKEAEEPEPEPELPLPDSAAVAQDSRTVEDKKDFHAAQVDLATVVVERIDMVMEHLAPGTGSPQQQGLSRFKDVVFCILTANVWLGGGCGEEVCLCLWLSWLSWFS